MATLLARQTITSNPFVTETATFNVQPDPVQTSSGVAYFHLTTTLAIYNVPINPPNPQYHPLADGSLITDSFILDCSQDKFRLVVLGLLLMLFSHNTTIAISYMRRVKIKNKNLFRLLLCSQLCGPVAIGSLLSPFFVKSASCMATTLVAAVFVVLSYSFLIPGILGIKAYRCLDRPPFILLTVATLHTTATALFISDFPNMQSSRRLTSSCSASGDLGRMVLAILLLMTEVVFICLCFLYAVWRSTLYPSASGRVSLRVSMNRLLSGISEGTDLEKRKEVQSRGWWDYVPEKRTEGEQTVKMSADVARSGYGRPGRVQVMIMRLFGDEELINQPQLKSSVHSVKPLSAMKKSRRETNRMSRRQWSKMLKFPLAMKDELGHTTAIAVTCALTVAVVVAGAFKSNLFGDPLMWVGLSWGLASLLILHDFGLVVRRNEREVTLQEPAAWKPRLQSPQDSASSPANRNSTSTTSTTAWSLPLDYSDNGLPAERSPSPADNPIADFEPVTHYPTESWQPQRFPQSVSRDSLSMYSSDSPTNAVALFTQHCVSKPAVQSEQ